MEQIFDVLPPLPTGNHICDEAVRSVARRGFHESPPPVALQPHICAQFGRLAEEISELIEISVTMKADLITEESADVLIVLCQLAWLYDMVPADLMNGDMSSVISLSVLQGKLWRAMRKDETINVRILLRAMAIHVRQTAGIYGIDIAEAIRAKLAKDEGRGRLHERDN